jgi:hypothetical protein
MCDVWSGIASIVDRPIDVSQAQDGAAAGIDADVEIDG